MHGETMKFLVLIYVRGCVGPGVTPSGIEPATFLLGAQCVK